MKTLSEYEAEKSAQRKSAKDDRIAQLNKLMDDIEAKDIPLYIPKDTNVDRCGYNEYRITIRGSVRSGFAFLYDLACDHCGTELVNNEPGMVYTSNPPKRRISCPGCGWTGFITS